MKTLQDIPDSRLEEAFVWALRKAFHRAVTEDSPSVSIDPQLLKNPPEPNDRLKEAAKLYWDESSL